MARSSGLATSRLASDVGAAVGGTGSTEMGQSGTAREVFDEGQRSAAPFQCCHGCFLQLQRPGTEPTCPVLSSAGWGSVDIPQDRVGVADDLPIAGRLRWIYRAESVGRRPIRAASRCAGRRGTRRLGSPSIR